MPKKKNASPPPAERHRVAAVLLFACAILMMAMVLIEGAVVWNFFHNFFHSLFGWCSLLVPVYLGYLAVCLGSESAAGKVKALIWEGILLLLLLSGALWIFTASVGGNNWLHSLGDAYNNGKNWGISGLTGAVLGYPMVYFFSSVGAKIIVVLLVFVIIMLVTRTSVNGFVKTVAKPAKKVKEIYTNSRERKRAADIDVDMGDGYQTHDILLDDPKRGRKGKTIDVDPALEDYGVDLDAEPAFLRQTDNEDQSHLNNLQKAARDLMREHGDKTIQMPADPDTGFVAPPYPPSRSKQGYRLPPVSLLDEAKPADIGKAEQEQNQTSAQLVKTLNDFGIGTRVTGISRGPSVTRYELEPNVGIKLSKITSLADDITMRLATTGVRIEAPIPNKSAVGIEVPNRVSSMVCLRELIDSPEFHRAASKLTVALGRDIAGKVVLADLAKMPHLLIAGTTGSGKSVCTNSMIQSILYKATPEDVRVLLIDPKQVEFGVYNGIPHLLVPVVTDPRKAAGALGWAVNEMLSRYKIFAENNVRDLASYNDMARRFATLQTMPQILIVIDELSDLMMAAASEVEEAICRLAQMARAAGMHLVIATQRPSVDVITGLIKANIPSRLALTVASAVDSRTIIDTGGADKLLGRGDMLFMPVGMSKPIRVQGCFVSDREVASVVDFLKNAQTGEYDEGIMQEIERQAAAAGNKGRKSVSDGDDGGFDGDSDDMMPKAIEVVVEAGMASTSLLQRRLKLGYARAGRIIDEMEQRGIVGPHEGSKPRQVLITRQQWLEMTLNKEE